MNTTAAILMFTLGGSSLALGCWLGFGTPHGSLALLPCVLSGLLAIASGLYHCGLIDDLPTKGKP